MTTPDEILRRLEVVRARIASTGVDPDTVDVLAVTKGHEVEVARAAAEAGLVRLGENYAAELADKAAALADLEVEWHMIGGLQTNKVKLVAGVAAVVQSVDRSSLVAALARRSPGQAVFVQVNVSGEDTKGGVSPSSVGALVDEARAAGLDVRGLMTLAAPGPPEITGPQFRLLRSLVDDLGLPECSMGMSADLEVAVAEGATMVRIGTALVGPRPPRP